MDRQTVIDQMWKERIERGAGGCAMCNTCGGNYSWKCRCARARFQPSDTEIEKYTAKKRTTQLSELDTRERMLMRQLERIREDRSRLTRDSTPQN
jgi:hypothetical protein